MQGTTEQQGIWREPVRGFHPDPRLMALPGLEMLRGYLDGRVLHPPIGYLVGLRVEEIAEGAATFSMPASRWLLSPQGVVSGSALALLADGPLGCAAQTVLPAGTPYTSAELSLSFIRPVTAASGLLTAKGRAVHSGRRMGLTTADIFDESGRIVAHAGSRLAIMPPVPIPDGVADDVRANPPRPQEPHYPTPHPWQRPATGETLGQEVFDSLSGLEVMQRLIRGDLPLPPIAMLTGLRPTEATDGATTWRMPASPWMQSPVAGQLYGGSIAHLAGTAVEGTVQTVAPAGCAFAPADLRVYFLRRVVPDGTDMVARGTVLHRGRTHVVASSEVTDSQGKVVALAMGSALLLPGHPASLVAAPEEEIYDEASSGD